MPVLRLRRASPDDIGFIMETERLPGYDYFIGRYSAEEHKAYLTSEAFAYLIGDSFAKLGLGMIADGTPIFGLTGWAGTFAALDAAAIGCICLMAIVAVFEERKIRRQKKTQTLQTA